VAEDTSYAVVVVTHNHADTIGACLAAVSRLEPAPVSVAVLDNASHDRSADAAADWARQLPLQLLRQDTNIGYAAGGNAGLAATESAWVLLLNPDCAPRPDFVACLQRAVAARPEADRIGSATGKLYRATGTDLAEDSVVDAAGMVVTPSGRHFDRGAGEADHGRFNRSAWVFGGTGAATLYRRSALEDVAYPGGEVLAESFFAYREDAELAWRLQWRSWRCLYEPFAVASHSRRFRPEEGRHAHAAINRHSVRNRFLLRLHCADAWWHLACFPWWLIRDLTVFGACVTVERSSLLALAEVWRLRHNAAQHRRWVMERRLIPSRRLHRWFRRRGWVEELTDS
jgi:GT2 family glycosyltransferase